MLAVLGVAFLVFCVWALISAVWRGATNADRRDWDQQWTDPNVNPWDLIEQERRRRGLR